MFCTKSGFFKVGGIITVIKRIQRLYTNSTFATHGVSVQMPDRFFLFVAGSDVEYCDAFQSKRRGTTRI